MSTISQYTFTNAYNADKLTKRQAVEMGISSYKIDAADSDSNGELSFAEIIADSEICDEIIKQINAAKNTVNGNVPEDTTSNAESKENISYTA